MKRTNGASSGAPVCPQVQTQNRHKARGRPGRCTSGGNIDLEEPEDGPLRRSGLGERRHCRRGQSDLVAPPVHADTRLLSRRQRAVLVNAGPPDKGGGGIAEQRERAGLCLDEPEKALRRGASERGHCRSGSRLRQHGSRAALVRTCPGGLRASSRYGLRHGACAAEFRGVKTYSNARSSHVNVPRSGHPDPIDREGEFPGRAFSAR